MSNSMVGRNFFYNKILIGLGIGFLAITPYGIYYYWNKYIRRNKRSTKIDNNEGKSITPKESVSETKPIITKNTNEISQPLLDVKRTMEILSKICENILNVLTLSFDIIKQDYILEEKRFKSLGGDLKEFTLQNFKLGCINNALELNLKLFKSEGILDKDYYSSLHYHLNVKPNDKIKRRFVAIEKVLQTFQKNDDIFEIVVDFPQEIKSNILKILSNTFYLNLKKVTMKIKSEILDKGIKLSQEEMKNKVLDMYEENLKETRKAVIKFFQVGKTDLKRTSLLRCYIFTLPRSDVVRQRYELLNDILHKVEDNLGNKILPTEFIDQSNEHYTNEIKNEIIDLERLLNNTIDCNLIY